ncbi:hypothetical protein N7520_011053 [Penicillium odoratum]|uniref:uncharacterized protein n=1 Tax=Penicillium odoratum TaxID=1167516 RepID=UPI00254808ED|nr:uncharacterized protein N7520_011053 [Penicillium odoratum]KAJ5745871.1 hypothetical protein N7520_011053 [Penicillium odoratum]
MEANPLWKIRGYHHSQFLRDNTFKCRYEPTDIDRIRERKPHSERYGPLSSIEASSHPEDPIYFAARNSGKAATPKGHIGA